MNTVMVSSDITMSDSVDIYLASTSNGNLVLTLPNLSYDQVTLRVINVEHPTNTVTIQQYGTETINGSPTYILAAKKSVALTVCPSGNWACY